MKFGIAIFGSLCRPALLCVEVILSGLTRQKFAAFGKLEALGVGLVGFNRHNVYPA